LNTSVSNNGDIFSLLERSDKDAASTVADSVGEDEDVSIVVVFVKVRGCDEVEVVAKEIVKIVRDFDLFTVSRALSSTSVGVSGCVPRVTGTGELIVSILNTVEEDVKTIIGDLLALSIGQVIKVDLNGLIEKVAVDLIVGDDVEDVVLVLVKETGKEETVYDESTSIVADIDDDLVKVEAMDRLEIEDGK